MFVLAELSVHVAYMISTGGEAGAGAKGKEPDVKGKGKKVVVEPSAAAEEEWGMRVLAGCGARSRELIGLYAELLQQRRGRWIR